MAKSRQKHKRSFFRNKHIYYSVLFETNALMSSPDNPDRSVRKHAHPWLDISPLARHRGNMEPVNVRTHIMAGVQCHG